MIFSVAETVYNGKVHAHLPKLFSLLSSLETDSLCPRPKVVVILGTPLPADRSLRPHTRLVGWGENWLSWNDFLDSGEGREVAASGARREIDWYRGGFDWPLWILFSSGTTSRRHSSSGEERKLILWWIPA